MKQNLGLNVIFLLVWSATLASANSGPSLNADCPFSVITPTGGTGWYLNETCTAGYILPPKNGVAEINSLARTTNLQFCPAVKSAGEVAKNTFDSMKVISEKIKSMISSFEPLAQEVIEMRKTLAENKAKRDNAKRRFDQAEAQLQEMKQAEREARKIYRDCLEDNSYNESQCGASKTEWERVNREFAHFRRGEYRNVRDGFDQFQEEFDLSAKRMEEFASRYTEAITPMVDLQERLIGLNERVNLLYKEYAKLEGATGRIVFSVHWDRLLEDFRRLNSRLRINWSKIPLKEAQLIGSVRISSGTSSLELAMPAIISATIPGARATGFASMGRGEKVPEAKLQPSPPDGSSIVFGDGVSGQIVFTLVGACPYFNGIEDRTKLDLNELSEYMAANLTYSYELAARRGYTVNYNLSNLLRKIEQKTQSGGFFSTEVAHSIAESNNSGDWFEIKFEGNASEFQYSAIEQQELTVTLKEELIDRAMKQFAVANAGAASPPHVPNFAESGAHRSSAELRKCYLGYCQVASAILGVANSIWGNSTATANFHRNNNVWTSERVNGVQFVDRGGSLTFE